MLLIGWGSVFLAVSATFLHNYSLGVLFGLAAVRNFVFSCTDALKEAGKNVPQWLIYSLAAVFAISTITASAMLYHLGVNWWVEFFICLTLLGLIVGNVLPGQNVMRVSFMANRGFNIINHIYFNNAIGVIIATCAIVSNIVYYIRQFIARRQNKVSNPTPPPAK